MISESQFSVCITNILATVGTQKIEVQVTKIVSFEALIFGNIMYAFSVVNVPEHGSTTT